MMSQIARNGDCFPNGFSRLSPDTHMCLHDCGATCKPADLVRGKEREDLLNLGYSIQFSQTAERPPGGKGLRHGEMEGGGWGMEREKGRDRSSLFIAPQAESSLCTPAPKP